MAAGIKSALPALSGVGRRVADLLAGVPAVILLSFVLAVGFLMIILSCALWSNWLPLLVGLSFLVPLSLWHLLT
jgi:hypothetical protein